MDSNKTSCDISGCCGKTHEEIRVVPQGAKNITLRVHACEKCGHVAAGGMGEDTDCEEY